MNIAASTGLPAYAKQDGSPAPVSSHFVAPTPSSHCCCSSHHQFCLPGPEPRVDYPDWLSQREYGHIDHIYYWNREDETLNCGVDRQQHPTDDVFFNNIVAMGNEEIVDEETE